MAVMHEVAFETEICDHLEAHGWLRSDNDAGYDRELALFPEDVLGWLADTQPEELAKVVKPGATDAQRAQGERRILERIVRIQSAEPANGGGTLNALKKPVDVTPARFDLLQVRPATGLNAAVSARYAANRLRVVRQVRYSRRNQNRIDLVLFVNGVPVATVELKTDLTQNAAAALKQYANDRNPVGEPLLEFGRGALVHLVASNELVYTTTRLAGANTTFLPFNRGHYHGAGNPPIEGTSPTAYLWQETWNRDVWLDLIGRFLHYRFEQRTDPVTGKKSTATQLRFPRYHQWRAVTRIEAAARLEGPGHNYLIQHSAGSGKTDSIAWTAHRLQALHREDGSKVFDGVIVVSDRQVLDGQLQRAVEQLESKPGVFEAVTRGGDDSKSKQLAAALLAGRQIIGVTLQTFPHALETIQGSTGLRGRSYAVIADEAHSSQSGEAAASLKQVLTADATPEETVDAEDVLADVMARRVGLGTISFVAFTATPKGKTVELFGREPESGAAPREFDLYPMKQAIQEGFILDVLKNYVSYDLAFSLAHAAMPETDFEVDQTKAGRELLRWVRLHPHNIAQKVQVIVEHFRRNVAPELGGRGKAMVVTASRKEAVRYKLAMEQYLAEHGLADDIGVLAAFSGSVEDPDSGPEEFTETFINPGLAGRPVEEAFGTDAFDVLIVANKFQTGFDQPLLVGMYVDKRLSGITTVQTLSRLNRMIPGKENTYVLDFVNEPADVLAAFQTYYEDAELQTPSNPDVIHDMLAKISAAHVVDEAEIDAVVAAWLSGRSHNGLYSHLKTSRDVFWDRWRLAAETGDEHERAVLEEFRGTVNAFVRTYDFLSQIVNYESTRIEKWAVFLRVFRGAIAREPGGTDTVITDDVVLTHYRLRRQEAQRLQLGDADPGALAGITEAGSGTAREGKYGPLSAVIDQINQLFAGTGVAETDQVNAVESILRHAVENPALQAEAVANTPVDFASSPTIQVELDELPYAAGIGHQQAIKALLQQGDLKQLADILLGAGLYEKLREAAVEEAD
jgi:type I restriction enzyme R subunit